MAKTYLSHAKYIIHQKFEIKGVVDKHDIIGAIFGQSEGIIGEDLDLRELQGSGKIGRIELELESKNGITNGTLTIPSGSDMVETSILAATIEVVDKVGPCDAKFETAKIEDTRITKRKSIIERAKSLLTRLVTEEIPDSQEIANEVRSEVRTAEITEYGVDKLPAGPHLNESEEIIVVEGRADVLNMLKYNIKNVVAMGGSKIPNSIVELCKRKEVIAFIDGDRGGELDLKRLLQLAEIDYIARAPPGREVEELTKKEILAVLSKKIPVVQTKAGDKVAVDDLELGSGKYWATNDDELDVDVIEKTPTFTPTQTVPPKPLVQESKPNTQYNQHNQYNKPTFNNHHNNNSGFKPAFKKEYPQKPVNFQRQDSERHDFNKPTFQNSEPPKQDKIIPKEVNVDVKKEMTELKNTLKSRFYDANGKMVSEVMVRDLVKALKDKKLDATTILFDGIATKRLVELAKNKGIKYLVCAKQGKMSHVKGIDVFEQEV
jgi:DNA primase